MKLDRLSEAASLTERERVATVLVVLIGLGLLAGVLVARAAFGVDTTELMWDPAASQEYPDYVGYVSHASVLAWTGGATAALLGASLLPRGVPARAFLYAFGGFTAWLAIDDLFRVHENVGHLAGTSAAEAATVLSYGAVGAALVWRHRRFVVTMTPLPLLGLAALFFATSVGVDTLGALTFGEGALPGHYVIEDGSKLLGTIVWSTYLVMIVRRTVSQPTLSTASFQASGPGDPLESSEAFMRRVASPRR
jgi:hypothetical protein